MIEWALNLFDDGNLQKLNMIASRNEYGNTMWRQISKKEIQDYFSEKLVEFMEAIDDFNQIDWITTKDIFHSTLPWKCQGAIQQAILSKIDEEKYVDLLSADGLDKTDPIIFDLIKADDPKVTAVLLTAMKDPKTMLHLKRGAGGALNHSMGYDQGYTIWCGDAYEF